MDLYEYDKWVIDTISQFYQKYYPIMKDYVFDRVLYWKLENSHNVVIRRDREWFKRVKPLFENLWDKVLFLRERPKEALKFKEELINKKKNKLLPKKDDLSKEELFVNSDSSDTEDKPIKINKKKISVRKKKSIDNDLFVDSD